jgi:hypothetical protein
MALVTCIHCGANNDPVAAAGFCLECGTSLAETGITTSGTTSRRDLSHSLSPSIETLVTDESGGWKAAQPLTFPEEKPLRKPHAEQLKTARLTGAATLFCIAIVHLAGGVIRLVTVEFLIQVQRVSQPVRFGSYLWDGGIVGLYSLLGSWALFRPLTPSIVGLFLYLLYLGAILQFIFTRKVSMPDDLLIMLVVKILLVMVLGRGMFAVVKATWSTTPS